MISVKSLTDSMIPGVYVKNITLNSDYKNASGTGVDNTPWGEVDKDPHNYKVQPTQTISDIGTANLMVSMKFIKTPGIKSEILYLLNSELKEYINIYVHQITDKTLYQKIIDKKSPVVLTKTNKDEFRETKKINLQDILSPGNVSNEGDTIVFKNEQFLADGKTKVLETVSEFSFNFDKKADFLAYIMLAAIKPSDIEDISIKNVLNETILSKVTSDIIILDGNFQNEGLVFTIAPYSKYDLEIAKFGKAGDIWAGPVHKYGETFMAGEKHTADPHPSLDYHIVPITKFIDNRVTDKLNKKVLNITKTYEMINSLTTKYTNTSVNLLDFEQYKSVGYISDIYLSNDSNFNVDGFLSIDKYTLLKSKSAFAFLFDNIDNAFEANMPKRKKLLDSIFKKAVLLRLSIYENETLMGTISSRNKKTVNFANGKQTKASAHTSSRPPNFSITREKIQLDNNLGLEHISFKKINKINKQITKVEYKVEVEYRDPTIQFVKNIIPAISTALKNLKAALAYTQMIKSEDGLKSGFNPYTQRLNEATINKLFEEKLVNGYGYVQGVADLVNNDAFIAYIYNPDIGYTEIANEIKKLSNIKTATLDHFLMLITFLNELKAKIEDHLASFGSKPTKTPNQSAYGVQTGISVVSSSPSKHIIKETKSASIMLKNYGYDFLGSISGNNKTMNIKKISAFGYQQAIFRSLSELINTPAVPGPQGSILIDGPSMNKAYKPKGLPSETLFKDGFSYLTIPMADESVRKSVILPKTVLSADENTHKEHIFNAIVKFKNEIFGNNSNPLAFDIPKNAKEGQLMALLSSDGMSIGPITKQGTQTTNKNENSPLFNNEEDLTTYTKSSKKKYTWPSKFDFNYLMTSLLNKSLLGADSFMPNMSKDDFIPFTAEEVAIILAGTLEDYETRGGDIPAQVKALSIDKGKIGPFKDFLGSDQSYIDKGVVNPLHLCDFWFIHQNIVKVEYLHQYSIVSNVVTTKNIDSPYEEGKKVSIKRRNVRKPVWKKMTAEVLSNLPLHEKLLCRIVKYKDTRYINNTLANVLNLPLMNNYFILEGGGLEQGWGFIEVGPEIEEKPLAETEASTAAKTTTETQSGPVTSTAASPTTASKPMGVP